ncbi:MAG: DUF3782 domain-containing protein [Desulfobacteraceae bacterium]|nr:DUF3782 domain-containing protein [Desulfobacteraceae bacterium]
MNINEIKSAIMQELPHIIRTDEEIRRFIVNLGYQYFPDRTESDRRFDRRMDELAEQRRQSYRKWEEQQKKLDKNLRSERSEQKYRTEQQIKWDEQQKVIWETLNEIKAVKCSSIEARWGLYSEESFRNGLKGILEKNFGVSVINITDYDDEGYVFGRPDQVELDIIIKNGILIICELKSSVSKSDMYAFERKARFYEKRHNRQATELIVISPMVDDKAMQVAGNLDIKVYTHAYDVKPSP